MKDVSDRHQDFALMSDLYTKESKPRTLSKMVPMRFNPARRSPASLPEPALKWHRGARAAAACPRKLGRRGSPTCRAEGPCPPSRSPTPSVVRSEEGEGMWCGGGRWKRRPQHTPAAGASCSGLRSAASLASSSGSSSRPARACAASPPPLGPPHRRWELAHK